MLILKGGFFFSTSLEFLGYQRFQSFGRQKSWGIFEFPTWDFQTQTNQNPVVFSPDNKEIFSKVMKGAKWAMGTMTMWGSFISNKETSRLMGNGITSTYPEFFCHVFFPDPSKLTSLWGPYPCYTGSGRVYSSKLMILHVMNLLSRKDPTPRKKGTKKQIQEIQVHGSNLYLILFALLKRTWLKKKLIHPFPHFAPWEDVAVPAPKARYALAMWLKDQGWYNNSFPKNLLDTWVYPKRLTRIPRIQPTWGIDFSRVYGGVYN